MDKRYEESRRQFKEWWEKFYETSPREPWDVIYSPEHDYYCDQDIDGQYDAWKASRASIVVELPDTTDIQCQECADDVIAKCETAIRSIGLSIKGE